MAVLTPTFVRAHPPLSTRPFPSVSYQDNEIFTLHFLGAFMVYGGGTAYVDATVISTCARQLVTMTTLTVNRDDRRWAG